MIMVAIVVIMVIGFVLYIRTYEHNDVTPHAKDTPPVKPIVDPKPSQHDKAELEKLYEISKSSTAPIPPPSTQPSGTHEITELSEKNEG